MKKSKKTFYEDIFGIKRKILQIYKKILIKLLTTVDKGAIIVNCIIIAYYAFFATYGMIIETEEKIRFDILYIISAEGQSERKVRKKDLKRIITWNGVIKLMVNVKEQRLGQNTRMSFAKSSFSCELPNLVEVQTKSFKWFLEE